ncbi:MAG: tRNA pseudouridine(55) synthase TruB [Clostridiales bacterium]|nr:tRNA pseudouridine(55) synthase TruB [Clostridiales bacterium]
MEGIINLLKPAGMTSHDAVSFLRHLLGERHIGHTGTLDPMAVGVLPLCVGNTARLIEYMDGDQKSYRCEFLLGLETDTLDVWGKILEDRRGAFAMPGREAVEAALEPLRGTILQVPPAYSALKVNGKPLYKYARSGGEVPQVEARTVTIHSLQLVSYDEEQGRGVMDVTCSKGTYIRSLCQELGDTLGCGAAMSFLARTASGPFTIQEAVTLAQLKESWESCLLPSDAGILWMGELTLREGRDRWFSNGGYLTDRDLTGKKEPDDAHRRSGEEQEGPFKKYYKVRSHGGRFMGTVVWNEEEQQFKADKVICREVDQ